MDRNLFRGKRLDNGAWVRGYLVHADLIREHNSGCGLMTTNMSTDADFECPVVRIDAATIGQCSGLRDKNGKLIYEGDICRHKSGRLAQIVWHDFTGSWDLKAINSIGMVENNIYWLRWEIIGNIHDNPEMLK